VAVGLTVAPGAVSAQKGKKKAAPAAKKARKARKAKPPKPAKKMGKPIKVDVAAEAKRLRDAKPDVAVKAAELLGRTNDPRALTQLLDALALGLDPKVAAVALTSVGAHGDVKAFDTVAYYARYRDPSVRAAAVGALASLDDSRAIELVLTSLRDGHKSVRAAASEVVAARSIKRGIEPMLELMKRGDEGVVAPLAKMADPDLARAVGELIGAAPDALTAACLGTILLKPGFKPEAARVEVVRALGKIAGSEAVEQLTTYIEKTPEKPPRQSRREAEALVEARLTGGI
jgi:HEAT repeat protein